MVAAEGRRRVTARHGEKRIVTAEWFPTKRRWSYEIMSQFNELSGRIWPDGTKKPEVPL